MKKIITYGTFDMFHYGHLELLRRAKELGDHLTVGVSTDTFNKIKGKSSFFNYEKRISWVSSIKYVDLVIPEENWDQKYKDIVKYDIDIFVMGSDWSGKFNNIGCECVYLERTDGVSSTELKSLLK